MSSTYVAHCEVKPSSLVFLAELWMEIMSKSRSRHLLLVPILISLFSLILCPASASSGPDFGAHPRFICTPIPVDADPACFPMGGPGVGPGHQSVPPAGWWGASDEAKASILHLRESLLQQKETILDQRETIRELTAKLSLCEGLGRGLTPHNEHHGSDPRHTGADSHHTYTDNGHYSNQQGPHGNLIPDSPHYPSMGAQRSDGGHSDHQGKDKHVRPGDITSSPEQMERMLQALKDRLDNLQKRNTSVAYSSSLKELLQRKINALEQQLRPPGQANEIVLIEWGDNPMELLIDDKALTLPLSLGDGEWHHICVTWSTRDGQWEAYQDGEQRGSGTNLSPWHPIKAGGVFILGQEQDILGGRFDATQSFVGEMSDLHLWSHVLPASDIYSLASCGSDLKGDVIAWSETEVELHGGVAKYPFDPCN
ncbi:hypothetical protein F7725_018401 [Dissostichus mawsoni]|uniref:Pentraxin (PTX) domain-containing protein n=1 Tax=Dissostichus mawsoni TaxID=36200 RepID=A0A7J5XRE3_DISMA|nr:hypothetical protein F7725_018401 [Dissostichus mawsoni]